MYQTTVLENTRIEIDSTFGRTTLNRQEIAEVIVKPETAVLSGSMAEKAEVFAEAATFALFLVMIIAAVTTTIYGIMETSAGLAELNYNQGFWFYLNGEI